jgi:hypothetical protein
MRDDRWWKGVSVLMIAASIAVALVVAGAPAIQCVSSAWLRDLGVEVSPSGYLVLSCLLMGVFVTALSAIVATVRGLLAVSRWASAVQMPLGRRSQT